MNGIRKVLFPTNFEELSLPALRSLFELKKAGLEEVVFLFVIDRDEVAFNLFSGFDRKLADELREEAQLKFDDWSVELEAEGLRVNTIIEVGSPETKILQHSCREEVDLIVAGRKRHILEDTVYLSGTTMAVIRRSTIPVMILKQPKTQGLEPAVVELTRHVLFATDFSEPSQNGFEYIKRLAGATGKVSLLHVIPSKEIMSMDEGGVVVVEEEDKLKLAEMEKEIEGLGVDCATHLLAGNPAKQIVSASNDHDCTMVVLGTTGKHGFQEFWLGSLSHKVAESSPVSVLLVPPNKPCPIW